MNHRATRPLLSALAALAATGVLASGSAVADPVSQNPLTVAHSVKPRVMLAMSNDNAMYFKAYTDWNDLDRDGKVDTKYLPSFRYYGYFDPLKCYAYLNSRFEPKAVTDNGYCDTVDGDWSGNFLNWAIMSRMDMVRKVLYGGYRSTDTAAETVLERAYFPTDAHSFAKFYDGTDIARLTPFAVNSITLCNTTYTPNAVQSQDVGNPAHAEYRAPRISVAKGDFRYWASNERWQCTWSDERGNNSSGPNTTGSKTNDPVKANDGLGDKDYTARVKVCVEGLFGSEACKGYPSGSFKPTGLLHDYGEDGRLYFGLMTGSYAKNKSGGVLRKNASSFADEVNAGTNGTFTNVAGIVKTLNSLRIARYHYDQGLYNAADTCAWGIASFPEGKCSSWGNPLSEIYLETLRYFAGLTPTVAFNADDSGYISGLGPVAWKDPLAEDAEGENWCAHCDIILINSSELSYDNDQLNGAGLDGTPDAAALTKAVGDAEKITGKAWFVGENGADNNQLCTSKAVPDLGTVRGACPGAPRLSGTYLLAGLAHWAHTHDIRALEGSQRVATRAVALLPGVPKLTIPVPGSESSVSILPACRNLESKVGVIKVPSNCAIVDFKLLAQDIAAGTGTAYVNWEDSEQGADYDQDMKGIISWAVNAGAGTITVTTDVNRESTNFDMGFGYIIDGTTQDGFHAHSGIEGYTGADPSGVPGCANCQEADAATSHIYTIGQPTTGLLQPPLWYTAKYGGFADTNKNKLPDLTEEWDQDGDGDPDGYFLANDPAELGTSLARFLEIIATTTSSAAVAANTTTLSTSTRIYQARYDSANWTGDLIAIPIQADGRLGEADWSARDRLDEVAGPNARRILTTNSDTRVGVPFAWGDGNHNGIAAAQKGDLRRLCPTCPLSDLTQGEERLLWLRGDRLQEVARGGDLRNRDHLLGDIANSEPRYVGAPQEGHPDNLAPDPYSAFEDTYAGREHLIYVGGNDGMLHAFAASDGSERFAYVPRAVFSRLAALTALDYQDSHRFYVNGGPAAQDAYLPDKGGWRTVLVGALGAGGASVFALDVTNPPDFASEATGATRVLWDIAGGDTGFEDLGYSFSKPEVVRLPDNNLGGGWAAVFGNGYHDGDQDSRGKAVLYIVDAEDGTLLDSVVADMGPANGLSSVAPTDYNGDGRVDYIYAGDIRGHLWRFEPDGVSGWKVSFFGQPLFTNAVGETIEETVVLTPQPCVDQQVCTVYKADKVTCQTWETQCVAQPDAIGSVQARSSDDFQPITVRPDAIRHPKGGIVVLFGTGSFYREGDSSPNPDRVNAFYGVWDRLGTEHSIAPRHLLERRIVAEVPVGDYKTQVTSNDPIVWRDTGGVPQDIPAEDHLGWYLKLVPPDGIAEGMIQVFDPLVHNGRIVFTTTIPSSDACDFGGDGWLVELDALSGGRPDEYTFDLSGPDGQPDGLFNELDAAVVTDQEDGSEDHIAPTVTECEYGICTTPTIVTGGPRGGIENKYLSSAREAAVERKGENPGANATGRRSWLQLH